MKRIESVLSDIKARINKHLPPKYQKRGKYAVPSYQRTILGFIACASTYIEQGGWHSDAAAFRDFAFAAFDTDRAESAFGRRYEIDESLNPTQSYEAAVKLLQLASIQLRWQQENVNEDLRTLFLTEMKAMRARERVRREVREEVENEAALAEMDALLAKIDDKNDPFVQALLETVREMGEELSGSDEE